MLPRIEATDRGGFRWLSPAGEPLSLAEVIALPGAEPDRWLPTHLEALDEVLIETAGCFGEVMGGGRGPARDEHEQLAWAYAAIDSATAEYHQAVSSAAGRDLPTDRRAGQIIGTGALMSIRLRSALGLVGAAPFEGELATPPLGPVGGTCNLEWVDSAHPGAGARWVVTTTEGARLPATLSMMLFDSSGVNKDASLDEHRQALREMTAGVGIAGVGIAGSGIAGAGLAGAGVAGAGLAGAGVAGAGVADAEVAEAGVAGVDVAEVAGAGVADARVAEVAEAGVAGVDVAEVAGVGDPMVTSAALDWLLFDWLMAHRESADSGAVEVNQLEDAALIVAAAAASVKLRRQFDPRLS